MQRSAMAFPQDNSANHEQVVVGVHPHWYRLAVPAFRAPVVLVLAIVGVSFVPPEEGEAIQYVIVAVGLLVRYSVLPWLHWKSTAAGTTGRPGDEYVLRQDRNLHWAGGINAGLLVAQEQGHPCYVLLNNDVRLSRGFLAGLLEAWEQTG